MRVKIQRSNGKTWLTAKDECLIFNREMMKEWMIKITPEIQEAFGDKYKIFADVDIKRNKLTINKILKNQNW